MQKHVQLTSAQTIAKYKNLRCYYALTYLTLAQSNKLTAFMQSVLANNTLNWCSTALASLKQVMQANALQNNNATYSVQQYSNLLLQHDTLEREQLNALLYKTHKALYTKAHANINVSLIEMY